MNLYLYYIDVEKPSNLLKSEEGEKTANNFFKIKWLFIPENLNDKK